MTTAADFDTKPLRERLREHIRNGWTATTVKPEPATTAGFSLPLPFSVPCPGGGTFRTMYYWDTYFTNRGLLVDGNLRQARNNAENFMHTVEHLGFIPNALKSGMNRTQPPVASRTYREIHERTGDKMWLRRALAATEREYAFWHTCQRGPDGLFHTRPQCPPAELWNFYWQVRDRVPGMPSDPVEQLEFLRHQMAEAAIGCDFTERFGAKAANFYPVLINSLVYAMQCDAAWFCSELGDQVSSAKWQKRAEEHRERCRRVLWSPERGLFLDFDFVNRTHNPAAPAETFVPLWANMADGEQAARVRANLPLFEKTHGIACGAETALPPTRVCQWDFPNAWPPLHEFAFRGLSNYGFKDDACRIARKYVDSIESIFESTGQLWEKFNAVTGHLDVSDEYPMPPFIGWTAGVYLSALEFLESR